MTVKKLLKILKIKVIDIGCNDGSLLNLLLKRVHTFGVEPQMQFLKPESGHNVYNNYFDLS